jgi:L-histidine Nalpha-methyltransferase
MQEHTPLTSSTRDSDRIRVRVLLGPQDGSTLAADVHQGLRRPQKTLPPKHFYDELGSQLFEQICDTPEYYPTRTELALLERVADDLVLRVRPTDVVELGSGSARKTRALFHAAERAGVRVRYVPFDVSESILLDSARQLTREYSWLEVHGVVGDYERHLHYLPAGERRLFLFIGGTIGNFEHDDAVRFLGNLAKNMGPEDRLLLGTDLVKPVRVLEAAYNDARRVTEAFNKNLLTVINRELDGNFRADDFEHVAFFDEEKRQIEMHLRSRVDQQVMIGKLALTVNFTAGETIRTEISRKFTRDSIRATLSEAGLEFLEWHTPPNGYFGLSLSGRSAS